MNKPEFPHADLHAPVEPDEMPLPSDPNTIFLGCLFAMALLAAAYVASDVVLPFVLAFILSLLLQPAMRVLERMHVPRSLGALLLIFALLGTIVGLGTAISGPAATWAAKLPDAVPRIEERLGFLAEPMRTAQEFWNKLEGRPDAAGSSAAGTVEAVLSKLFTGTKSFASGLFTTILFLFFLLVSGELFVRRLVEILPRFGDKRQVVDIARQTERDISTYLVTITVMNAVVGIATGLVMWLTGVSDPILWGGVAFLLNYVPIIGPVVGIVLFFLAGLLSMDTIWQALLPAALYFGIHLIEGETLTPHFLARRFTLNPVAVILSLIFWFWMWGAPGAIISVPLLAIVKIVCDRIRPLAAVGHFLEG